MKNVHEIVVSLFSVLVTYRRLLIAITKSLARYLQPAFSYDD
jgi:hypothetical protein